MGSFPFGPHGPETRPYDVTPNPTPSSPGMMIGGGDAYAPAQSYGGGGQVYAGGGAGGGLLANIFLSFVLVVVLLWTAFICLYPLTALAGYLSGFFTASWLHSALSWESDGALVTGVAVGAVVIWTLIRVEYRLGQVAAYRLSRHVVRMLLLGLWVIPMILMAQGAGQFMSYTVFMFSVLTSPAAIVQFFRNPVNLGTWVAVMVGLHFLIWKSTGARNFWHRRLKMIGMK